MRSKFIARLGLPLFGLLLGLLALTASARAQSRVTLGNSSVELTGPWKFQTGDNMAWASPNFDDSAWGTMDLTPPQGSTDPFIGVSGFVPGWTARGHAGYSGYAWYRLQVNLQNNTQTNVQSPAQGAGAALALKMPADNDDAYQVYVNGQFAGQFGRFTERGVTFYISQPRAFPLPAGIRSGPMTIAIRMWMDAATPLVQPDAGGLHGPPVLGQASAIGAMLRLDWNAVDRSAASHFLQIAILLLALLVVVGLYGLDRGEPAYLWLGLTCAVILLYHVLFLQGFYTTWMSGVSEFSLQSVFLMPVRMGLWVVFWAYWFRLNRMTRLHRMVWGLVALLAASAAMQRASLYGRVVPVHAIVWLSPLTLLFKLLLGMLLVWVTYRGIRGRRTEGWLALPAVLLVTVSLYQDELLVLHVPTIFFPFGFAITLRQIATVLSLGIITVLLLRRFLQSQRQREQWRLELEQARQVQQVLIPATLPTTPGFAVESVYLPASQVGGDFFQIQPGADGSLLVVVGDVSGKGLKAAMTVSTIVGALRNEPSRQPAQILTNLNRALHGQISGFVTCCATFISAEGKLTIANAGHLSPYRNGEELNLAGGLPLGILAESTYEEVRYELAPGDRLTLLSDGVVEARDARGQLFGFDRTSEFLKHARSAAEMAGAAQHFGQEDDITVLSVVRET